MIAATILGVGVGVMAALGQNRAADYAASAVTVMGVCVPTFVTAPLLALIFASTLGCYPRRGGVGALALIPIY